jgi:hypothetical protein
MDKNKLIINPKTGKADKRLDRSPDKLSDEQVLEIRKKYKNGNTSLRKLATEYGVSHVYIGYLIHRKKRISI